MSSLEFKVVPQKFYIARHGQTTGNKDGLASGGGVDVLLTELGFEQARKSAKVYKLLNPQPTDIYVTDLTRTHQTAETITGLQVHEFIKECLLNERHLGIHDGKLTNEQKKQYEKEGRLEGAQTKGDHQKCVIEGLNKALSKENSVPMIVAHEGTIRRILETLFGNQEFSAKNGQIYEFVPDKKGEKWKVYELSAVPGRNGDKLKRTNITESLIGKIDEIIR